MTTFDHVYLEESVVDHPRTRDILTRLRPRHTTVVSEAHRVFNRPQQDFAIQKRNPKLILAEKRETFLYEGRERIRSFGTDRPVFYNDTVRNCLYDCDYCFLQGMHRSANILLHVNLEDYLAAVDRRIEDQRGCDPAPLYLSVSYLTDLLGFERHFGISRFWIESSRTRPHLEVEIRTKGDGYSALRDCRPSPGIILTWSLSPDEVVRDHEHGTAAFQQRLLDARRAIQAGWRVRLCFDPVIVRPGWETRYPEAVRRTFARIPAEGVEAVSFGVFRMHPDFVQRLPVGRDAGRIAGEELVRDSGNGVSAYSREVRDAVFGTLRETLSEFLPSHRIHAVHG